MNIPESGVGCRLARLGIVLPDPAPTHEFSAVVVEGSTAYVSGHAPYDGRFRFRGKVGRDIDLDGARRAAELAVLGCLSSFKAAGHLERIARVIKVQGYVNATEDFQDLPRVTDAASDLLYLLFGSDGRHARTTVGVATLPAGVAVEVDMIVRLRELCPTR